MNVGTSVPLPAYTLDAASIARKAEELGFESLWYAEHPVMPVHSSSPFPATGGEVPESYSHFADPFIALARASGVTTTLTLGTGQGYERVGEESFAQWWRDNMGSDPPTDLDVDTSLII